MARDTGGWFGEALSRSGECGESLAAGATTL
jgi:hypothetical protein